MTLHPPDSYLSTYSFTNVAFFQRELTDMAAAAIDVALPAYWGDPANVSLWSVPGLRLLVQAEQAMAQAGQLAPKIGMFADTTSLPVGNGGVKPDLTTTAGKSLFYGYIHTFFSNVPKQFWATIDSRPILVIYASVFVGAYDQSTFDYISQQFQQDFGTTPYIILHPSWLNVTADALYAGWPTYYNANFAGDVASVNPGHDNLGVSAEEKRHTVVDRNCGDLYQQDWDQVLSHGARLVLIEDWNELFEGSGISATKEYGRRYIEQTANNIARWKTSPDPAPSSPPMVWGSLGSQLYQSGLYTPFNFGGGAWLTTQSAGHDAMYPDHSAPSYYLYLATDERFLSTRPSSVWVSVEYLDTGNTPWRLEFDGANSPFTATAQVAPQNTGLWKTHTFTLPDALFQKRENPNTDFRIDDSNTQGVVHYFNRIWVTKSAPYGQPPQMPLLPDISVSPGGSIDVPLNALDSSGKPLPVSLAIGPGFASVQGKVGAQTIHLAPSVADQRSCADVTGPGISSSPSYRISAVANDPNSLLSSGVTSFSVTVGLRPAGSMAQLASGGGWDTTLTLVNTASVQSEARLNFFDNAGNALPLNLTQAAGGPVVTSTYDQVLNPNSLLVLDSQQPGNLNAQIGSAQLNTGGNVGGFAIFRYTPTGQEAVVPLETRNAPSYVLAFDNTGGLGTGVALANVAAQPVSIPVILRDDTGVQIGTDTITLAAQGHTSFMLTANYAVTAGKRGTIELDTPFIGQISALGLRANGSALTTLPVLANVTAGGGSMAHVASGGGWQTTFTLVNTGTSSAQAQLSFFDNNGNALPLLMTFLQSGTATTTSTISQTIAAGATLVVLTQGDSAASPLVGSAQLTTTGNVSGFAIFRYNPSGQEAVVPLETRNAGAYVLAFDNMNNLSTGLALANVTNQAASVPVVLRDDTGTTLGTATINLAPHGHTSFVLTGNYSFAANKRGTVEFDTPAGAQLSAVGLRATPTGVVTTVPVLAK